MAREKIARHILLAFAFALALYFVSFGIIEHLRTYKGGWQVNFRTDSSGHPSLTVSQPKLRIANVRFNFPNHPMAETNLQNTLVFDQPITNVPFGKVIYLDTTFLPGAIVFELFNHQIQLLPRVLILDRREVPWQSGQNFELP